MSQNCQLGDRTGVLKVERCKTIFFPPHASELLFQAVHVQPPDRVLQFCKLWQMSAELSTLQLHRSCYNFQKYRKPFLSSDALRHNECWMYEGRTS